MWRGLTFSVLLISFFNVAEVSADVEFKKWLSQHKKEFKTFVDEHDKEFADFLKANWVEIEVKPEEQRDSTPKPIDIPVAPPAPEPGPEPIQPDPIPPVLPPVPPVEPLPPVTVPDVPPPSKTELDYSLGGGVSLVSFLGHKLKMPTLGTAPLKLNAIVSDRIADAWLTMAKTQFKEPVQALKAAAAELSLDDWGQALLTHAYLASNSKLNSNEMQLYSWFYLVKQGFDARIAFSNEKIYLMLAVEQKLFGQKYFALTAGKYYFVDLAQKRPVNVGSVYTYDKQHASASEKINIDLSVAPVHAATNKIRRLTTQFNQQRIEVNAPYNLDYIEYLDHYPQLSMDYYFKAELPEVTREALVSQLRPHIEGVSERQALNLLLRFVQTSLLYQTDQQQFNFENYLFAGETLHYPYADCEDRAVLYAYLVKHLLGNQVIGLQYDGHIATAVAITSDVSGDTFKIKGKTYVVADPTFINANLGHTMTGFETQTPEFIFY